MATYYVDDGGSNTDPFDTWAKAATSIKALDDAKTLVSNDVIYIGHDHVDPTVYAASEQLALPQSGAPALFFSVTQGSSPPTYQKAVSSQLKMGTHNFTADGSGVFVGLQLEVNLLFPTLHATHDQLYKDCKIIFRAGGEIAGSLTGSLTFVNCEFDASADASSITWKLLYAGLSTHLCTYMGGVVTNGDQRTGTLFAGNANNAPVLRVSGMDVSSLTNATLCEILASSHVHIADFSNLLTHTTWAPWDAAAPSEFAEISFVNCGPANAPTYLARKTAHGEVISTSDIYRTDGATVNGDPLAWLITTTSGVFYGRELVLPWLYGSVSAGSKTFTCHITNDTADFTEADVYLEVEYQGTSGEAITSNANDGAVLSTSSVAQTDDATSTWNGTGPAFTYKQKLEVTATIAEAGTYRARVRVRLPSIAGSRYFYVDPKIIVS